MQQKTIALEEYNRIIEILEECNHIYTKSQILTINLVPDFNPQHCEVRIQGGQDFKISLPYCAIQGDEAMEAYTAYYVAKQMLPKYEENLKKAGETLKKLREEITAYRRVLNQTGAEEMQVLITERRKALGNAQEQYYTWNNAQNNAKLALQNWVEKYQDQ